MDIDFAPYRAVVFRSIQMELYNYDNACHYFQRKHALIMDNPYLCPMNCYFSIEFILNTSVGSETFFCLSSEKKFYKFPFYRFFSDDRLFGVDVLFNQNHTSLSIAITHIHKSYKSEKIFDRNFTLDFIRPYETSLHDVAIITNRRIGLKFEIL
ncbi:hypothetical protein RF11_11195 [Thelohanellus kitauei]|uniref:Uncharacterized protein n=1 Tax=Thelohanellus kitauei TaxID=669202 RepID=A0A0C2MJ52_THEKT|nr:hypothetical protein RF11_11195 [Thelohanellus kitauei]